MRKLTLTGAMHLFPFELIREGHLANEDSVDLSVIFFSAPEAFLPFTFRSTPIQRGELEYRGRNGSIYSYSYFQLGFKKLSTLGLSCDL